MTREEQMREKRRKDDIKALTPEDYYNPQSLLEKDGDINVIWGQRSNGKTYSYLKLALETYKKTGRTFVYVRRWAEDIVVKNMSKLMKPLPVKEIFGDEVAGIRFYRGAFELVYEDEAIDNEVIGWAVALNQVAHTKSQTFADVKIIILDEFLQLKTERILKDEFDAWEQTVSTITRTLQDVKIFILGNSVCKYTPYFTPYGIQPNSMKQGDIKVIELPNEYGDPTRVVAEWCKYNPKIGLRTSKYVRGSKMAKTGEWEIQDVANIPHTDNEIAKEKLLCSLFDSVMNINLGIFLRYARWTTYEVIDGIYTSKQHERQFLVIRQTQKQSSFYHLTNVKTLTYNCWTDANTMFKAILEETEIDIMSELQHNRLYCEDMFVADYFYHTYLNYSKMSIRDLL